MSSEAVKFSPIEEGGNPWTATVNGIELPVHSLELKSKWGTLQFGQGSDGRKGWLWSETGGGGSVTMPWSKTPEGDLLVGLLSENRQNMGGVVDCVIGGFVKPKESHPVAAEREQDEEASIPSNDGPLPGVPVNSNRLFFQANPENDEGVHSYHVEVPFTDLVPLAEHPGWYAHASWEPKHGAPLTFKPIEEAALSCPDALAYPAMLRLLLQIRGKCGIVLASD